ncbi:MAG: hypothetical protein U0528_07155 [Anaerolineae bacterium]
MTKAFRYLNDGVQVVWLVLPTTKAVYVYRSGIGLTAKLNAEHQLEDVDLLPEFSVKVAEIFPE